MCGFFFKLLACKMNSILRLCLFVMCSAGMHALYVHSRVCVGWCVFVVVVVFCANLTNNTCQSVLTESSNTKCRVS